MSTIIKTEFGNYETYNERVFSISPELQSALGGRQIHSISEMQNAVLRLREQRNREIRRTTSRKEQNRKRMEKQMEDLQLQMAAQVNDAIRRSNEQSNRRMDEQQQKNDRRLKELEKNVNSNIRKLREQQNNTIREMEKRVQESMKQMHTQIEANARDIEAAVQGINHLSDYVGEMEKHIEGQFRQQQQQIKSIQDQLIAIGSRGEERAKIAIEWMEAVEKSNQLDRFVPEDASSVRRRLQNLKQSGSSGAELASLANEAIIAAQELEIKCNRERLKYEQKEEMTRTMLETVLEIVYQNREIELSDDEGNPVKVENNFWSKGRYNALSDKLEALRQEIEAHANTDLSMDRLDEMQREICDGEVEIREITAQSVQRVTLSQARMQTVYDIVGAMEEQHWQVIESNGEEEIDYKGGETSSDFREGAFARLRNSMGEEVTVMVDPDEEQQKNTLGFHFSGSPDTDEENERKTNAVAEQLRQSGYEIGVPKCAGHMPMPEMESVESMTQKGASERIRERERATL